MKKPANWLLAAVMFIALGAMCQATSITVGPVTLPADLTDWSKSIAFTQFDSTLGILNSVELDLTASMSTTLTVINGASSNSKGSAMTEVATTVQDVPNLLPPIVIDANSPKFSYTLSPGASTTSGLLTWGGSSSNLYTAANILAEFTGNGAVSFNADTFTQTLLANNGGNTTASQITNAGLAGTVIYNYTPVPEPTTLCLFGLGLAGLGFVAKKKSRKQRK